jgi:predicted TIM-barrel fold metal-dependent hydrolase
MPFIRAAWARPSYAFTAETYLDMLDAHGVHYGVIAAASLFGTFNDYTIAALRRFPRLRGTVIVDPEIGFYELEGMKRDGVVGIRLQLFHVEPLPDFGSDAYVRLFHRLRDLDMHVHVNVEPTRLPAILAALQPSGVKIVIDHFGWPDETLGLEDPAFLACVDACRQGQAWVKLSGGYRNPSPEVPRVYAQAYVERVGSERLFWGSDVPFVGCEGEVTYGDTIRQFAYWLPDPAVRDAISRNTYRFYFE